MSDSYHATAEGHRTVSGENILLENGIMMRKDVSVQQELESEMNIPGLMRKLSAEDDMRYAISASERV